MTDEIISTTSRYYAGYTKGPLQHTKKDGTVVQYLRRRFIPAAERIPSMGQHSITEGDRPDTIAATVLGDSQQSWRLYDANACMHPDDLTEQIGRDITLPMPGTLISET
jgi:hypothetical protein